jgi:hypothetical protein
MVDIHEDLEALRDDGVGFPALHIDDEADAAGVVLIAGIVESLCPGRL